MTINRLLPCLLWMLVPSFSLLAAQQQPPPQAGGVIVLAEPGAITLPPGLMRVPAGRATVARASLAAVFQRLPLEAIRRATPRWDEFRAANPGAKVYARRKNELMPPDALADLSLLYVLEFPAGTDLKAIVAELNQTEGIVYAEPDRPIRSLAIRETATPRTTPAVLSPNDPLFVNGQNWGFNGTWGTRASQAWDIQTGQPTTRIAIFDSGIEAHTDFGGTSRIADQYDFVNDDANAFPDLDQDSPAHGMGVAGVAAAQTNDNFGTAGMCGGFAPANPGCQILAAKVLGSLSIIQSVTEWLGLTSIVADATNWALARQVNVINNSWCNETEPLAVHDAFRNAYLTRVLITAGAGNNQQDPESGDWDCGQETPSEQVAPAAFHDILMSIGATDQQGFRVTRARGFNWESGIGGVAVVAPGVGHFSDSLGNGTQWFGGTSEATPFVSGLAGLIFTEAAAKGFQFTAWDVRQLIEKTARPPANTPPGYNSETGWGLIDANKALQTLQPPNELAFVTLGNVIGAQCVSRTGQEAWTFWASFVVMIADRCEIRRNITFAKRYSTPPTVWGRPVAGGGVTPSDPNSEIFFTGIVPGSVTTTGATLVTYVYQLWTLGGSYQGWYPAEPSQVNWGYAVVGEVAPFSVTAGAPGFVTQKTTYSLSGSASDPANSWRWDQSYDGGPYGFWANGQNSSFIAYAGNYTLDWRLQATRNFDSQQGTGFATTRVCIPYNPSTCEMAIARRPMESSATGVSVSLPNVTGAHFGSGIWLGANLGTERVVLRTYSFQGTPDAGDDSAPWPNVLERDAADWRFTHGPLGDAVLSTRRYPAGPERHLLRVRGQVARSIREVTVGLAADPDLGEPTDDRIGFDADLGLAWVSDTAERRFVGYMALEPDADVQVRQFSSAADLGNEPSDPTQLYDAMISRTGARMDASRGDDIRLLLSAPAVSVDANGRLRTTFAVLRATTLEGLLDLARKTRIETATLLAGIPNDDGTTAAGGFGLRQRLSRAGITANVTAPGGETAASAVSELQANGITALEYSVPSGREIEVRIRVYNQSGQPVRSLVRETVPGGQYQVQWDLLNDRGQRVSPGVYVAVMEAEGFRATRKLVVTR